MHFRSTRKFGDIKRAYNSVVNELIRPGNTGNKSEASSMMGALSCTHCTDARLYTIRLKIDTRTTSPHNLLSSPQASQAYCISVYTVKPVLSRQNKDLNDKWYLNEGRKYCRMLQGEHSTILLTCIKQ